MWQKADYTSDNDENKDNWHDSWLHKLISIKCQIAYSKSNLPQNLLILENIDALEG